MLVFPSVQLNCLWCDEERLMKEKEPSDPFKLTVHQIRAKPSDHRSCYRPDLCLNRCFYCLQAILASCLTEAECSPDQKVLPSSHSVCFIEHAHRGGAVAVFLLSAVRVFLWFQAFTGDPEIC